MTPLILPFAERLGRYALHRRGVISRSVATPSGPLHVYDAKGTGTLPTIVLLHGIGSAATPFGPVLTRLLRHSRRVVAPDYPGHGFSAAPTSRLTMEALETALGTALAALELEPAILVGNSLGGALALRYAIARPERVRALVLLSPAGAQMADGEWEALKKSFALASRADALAFVRRIYHRPSWLAGAVMSRELPLLMSRPAIQDLLASATPEHATPPEALGALAMPILLSWGRSERLLPPSCLAYFKAHLPRHALVEEPTGFGHCPHFDDPAALARRIVSFARTLLIN